MILICFILTAVMVSAASARDDDDDRRGGGGGGNGDGGGGSEIVSHIGYYTTYEGSKTCLGCHASQVRAVHASLHYQWQGPTPYVPGMTVGGKLGAINDFCGYPDINFIGLLTNLDGQVLDGGCAVCHTGMGLKPSATATQEQLENIDCLICHSDEYRRKVVRLTDGSFRFAPAPERMTVPLVDAITRIHPTPTRGACVSCHAYAGGGNNNKRGDLEEAHRDPPNRAFDVHMASVSLGGAGLNCIDCHTASDHRIAGRGVDTRATDLDVAVRCTNCHSSTPHRSADLNRHTARIDCTVCHIPNFAKITSTDMLRDFSQPAEIEPGRRLYEPHVERQTNVVPEYRFFNGFSTFYNFGAPAVPGPNGRVLMAGPLGDIHDPSAKIYAFKHHLAVEPLDNASQRIIPTKAGILFQTGNIDAAIRQGAAEVGWPLTAGYSFVPTERYMGIFHEVAPKEQALTCTACHFSGTRMDFAALGYTPRVTRNGRPLCRSCHGAEDSDEEGGNFFTWVHDEHVREERISCSQCHDI